MLLKFANSPPLCFIGMESGMISVDHWSGGSQAYFLTHLHSDHTIGLSPSWNHAPIFCSPTTANLLPFMFPGLSLALLRVTRVGKWHPISLVSPSSGSDTQVHVMAIDAHHCPGSVMYLFRGDFGCMLYTGDFRWEKTCEKAQIGKSMLLKALGNNKLDIVYLDNTYCNPSFSFPSRDVAAQLVVEVINAHPNHEVIIGIDSLGKEDLLVHIARALKMKIWVWPERLQIMHLLGFEDVFTTKTSLTRVRAVPRYSFSVETLEGLNEMHPTIGIMPSGLPWVLKPFQYNKSVFGLPPSVDCRISKLNAEIGSDGALNKKNESSRTVERHHKYIYSVPFSNHSCFTEIKEFVKLVQPAKVKGIVSSPHSYVDPLSYFGILYKGNQIPTSLHRSVTPKRSEEVEAPIQSEITRKRTKLYDDFRAGRVTIMRRTGHGAKIVQID